MPIDGVFLPDTPPCIDEQVGVSMILSFMIVWDLPTISEGASSLKKSRLSPYYNELAPILVVFGQLFGKALQAQAVPSPTHQLV